jgi:hypothetical protein
LLDLLFDTINLLSDYVWGGIAVVVAILILTSLGFLAKTLHSNRTRDLTRDELRLLVAFNEQAKENRSRDLSVEFAAYKAEVDNYEVKLQRLKALGYTCKTPTSRAAILAIAPFGSPPKGCSEPRRGGEWR